MKNSSVELTTQIKAKKNLLTLRKAVDLLDKDADASLRAVMSVIVEESNNPLLWVVKGRAHERRGDSFDAEQAYNNALSIDYLCEEALFGKAELLIKNERCKEAELFLNKNIANFSGDELLKLKSLRATTLLKQKKYEQAIDELEYLTQQLPENDVLWSNLGMVYQAMADFKKMEYAYSKAIELTVRNPTAWFNLIVGSHYNPDSTPESIMALCQKWQSNFQHLIKSDNEYANSKIPERKLRIGMISDGFRSHPVGNMITTGMNNVPEEHIEFYAYSTNSQEDHITHRIKNICVKWKLIDGLSDESVIDIIRQDKIDILFDLCGYNANSRMLLFLRKPAPVQIKWVGGLISSTGLQGMDYLMSDHIETPEGADSSYTEKLIRMPGDYICYDPPHYLPPVNELPCQKNGYITFGCFNNAAKINDQLLEQWARLLNAVPDSRLFLKSFNFKNKKLCERVTAVLEKQGINRERVILEQESPHRELLASYNRVDIALDPWPYSGGLTTCEAMAMGVPVVTLPGPTFAGRHSASHLVNAGMPELVAASWEQYINIAVGLTNDLASLGVIRQHLREILLASPVCNGAQFARHFSDAMRAVWQRYCAGKEPEALSLTEDNAPVFLDDNLPLQLKHPQLSFNIKDNPAADDFKFELSGKVIMMDYGGNFCRKPDFIDVISTEAIHAVIIDPALVVEEKHLPLRKRDIQHVKGYLLGNAEERDFFMCLDAAYSSDLPVKDNSENESSYQGQQVLSKVKFPSVKLDEIDGLNRVDWLCLDNKFDVLSLFNYGGVIISSCLFIDIKYRFDKRHDGQLTFSQIEESLAGFGFRFHAFGNVVYDSLLSCDSGLPVNPSRIIEAQLYFVPCESRLATLSVKQIEKLAFILHAGYKMQSGAAEILRLISKEKADNYLVEVNAISNHQKENLERQEKHNLPERLIVSLTSYHKRFKTLPNTLDCLLKQSVKPDRIVLWLAEAERSMVPSDVIAFESKGVEIKYCDDIRSYKKIIPTLEDESGSFIVTADDDLFYDFDWLKGLISSWDGNYKTVVAHRAHKIVVDQAGDPINYREWNWQYSVAKSRSGLIFPTTGFGTLYPPYCFHKDVTSKDIFEKLCYDTDDIWLYWMCRLNGVKFIVTGADQSFSEWEGCSENALWHKNLTQGQNDINIKKMIDYYGFPADKKSG